ncbi:hypothetical protein NW762_006502 [Fusarium torreyae]|uniref:Glucose-methanol-choline oxidoreductase N-terminal domain-containing protein n=1 Tax=Fusarium torreyae TaxID=1237075 RepID=A0A9W8RZ47_9HYPO|nr:hypothetical protein NW762_006502 [Fusarium torreyae]
MLGGSSGINSHSLVFPNKAMHEAWAEMSGDDRWGWERIKHCYSRFQTEQQHTFLGESSKTDGPVQASFPRKLSTLQKAWEAAFENLGASSVSDGPSGEAQGGFTTRNAIDSRPGQSIRSFASNAYLDPVLGRQNLVVICGANVEKIIFEDNGHGGDGGLRAVGVIYEYAGKSTVATANREVIVCAGAVGSPKILEHSGLGDKNFLEALGIRCLVDLPGVGENLQDHLNFGPSVEVVPDIQTLDAITRNPAAAAAVRREYDEHKTGPFAEGGAYSFAHWPLQLFNTQDENNEIQALLQSSPSCENECVNLQHRFIDNMILDGGEGSATVFLVEKQRYTTPSDPAPGNYMSILAMLSHPYSRGSCHIRSADWRQQPLIDCAYLSHPLDIEILARHVLQIDKLLAQDALAGMQKNNGHRLPIKADLRTLKGVKEAIRGFGATNYHLCGTCAMLRDGLKSGVVNGALPVRGTTNLRVCDASVFPIIPRGNILSSVYAVAEKASEFLIERYN